MRAVEVSWIDGGAALSAAMVFSRFASLKFRCGRDFRLRVSPLLESGEMGLEVFGVRH